MTRARDVADTQDNIGGAVAPFVGAKNRILNGDFSTWQRGTSFTLPNGAAGTYCPDRFIFEAYGTGTAATVSRQTFTPGSAPASGYESQFFARLTNFSSATAWQIRQRVEDVRTFAGQTVTFSFWARAGSAITNTLAVEAIQNFGSGGSATVFFGVTGGGSISTSWTRYSYTFAVPSVTGKTIGAGSYFEINFYQGSGATNSGTIDTWGWQVEAGNVATPFTTATGNPASELAACQRYYQRVVGNALYGSLTNFGAAASTTVARIPFSVKQSLRGEATSVDSSSTILYDGTNLISSGTLTIGGDNLNNVIITCTTSGLTAFRPYQLLGNNNTAAFLGISAEL